MFCDGYIQKTKSGLFIPEKAQDKVNVATVIAIGPGRIAEVLTVAMSQWPLLSPSL